MKALYGKKVGMTQIFDNDGTLVPVTVLSVESSVVVGKRDMKKNGYDASILATFKQKKQRCNKAKLGLFGDIEPRKKVYEIRGFENIERGSELGVEIFDDIIFVDVTGTSKGKGHQGVMKRHGAHGGPAAHGSKFHRTGGSTGHAATPSRVRKGTKMSGRMGTDTVTVQNLRVVKVDKDNSVIIVGGAVPGAMGSMVLIREALKKGII